MAKKNKLGAALKSARKAANLSIRKVAKTGILSDCYLSELERGILRNPSASILVKLAALYKVDAAVFTSALN